MSEYFEIERPGGQKLGGSFDFVTPAADAVTLSYRLSSCCIEEKQHEGYTLCPIKRVPDVFSYNSNVHHWILITFRQNIIRK